MMKEKVQKGTSANPWKDMTSSQKTGAVIDAVGAIGQGLGVATSGQDVNVGTALSTAASMAGAGMTIGGPIGAAIGAGVGAIMGTAGRKAGYDADSSSTNFDDIYDPGSGWLSWFGHKGDAKRKANQVQNSNISKIQSENIKEMYYSNPNVTFQPITAAEGGIMRQPVDALISKGELIYNPVTKKLSQVPGSKGKPNKADDVYAKLYEGDVVISNSPTMLMANGKTPAQNLMGMVDKYATGGTVKAREAIIKKVVNWQEANKTKPQEYAKFDGGGIAGVKKYGYNKNMSEFAYWDKDKNEYKKEYLDWVNNLTKQDVRDIESGKYGDMSEYFSKNKGKKLDVTTAQKLMTDKKYGNWHKIGKAVVDKKMKKTTPSPEDTVIRRPERVYDYEEPVKTVTIPADNTKIYGRDGSVRYYYNTPERKVTPVDLGRDVVDDDNDNYTGSNWKDNLYRMMVLTQPFWDKATAESVNYESPVYKYIPTQIDVSSQLRDTDQSYALARYNFANLYPNTGAGMAAGLQAAANRAKQYADIRQYQTNAQNELIGKNVGIYNNWANEHARIMNDVYNKTAANRAAARNINRQNLSTSVNNFGQILRDRKLHNMDKPKTDVLKPLFEYGYKDYDTFVNWLEENGYGSK